MTREKLTANIVADLVELRDDRLALVATLVRDMVEADRACGTARRIDGEALAAAQRAREQGLVQAPTTDPSATVRGGVLAEISAERDRQIAKWGDGVPGGGFSPKPGLAELIRRDGAQQAHDEAAGAGRCTMRLVLEEEVAEVFAEQPGSPEQRAELVQVAAVAVKWIEAIDVARAEKVELTEDEKREAHQFGRLTGIGFGAAKQALEETKARQGASRA